MSLMSTRPSAELQVLEPQTLGYNMHFKFSFTAGINRLNFTLKSGFLSQSFISVNHLNTEVWTLKNKKAINRTSDILY